MIAVKKSIFFFCLIFFTLGILFSQERSVRIDTAFLNFSTGEVEILLRVEKGKVPFTGKLMANDNLSVTEVLGMTPDAMTIEKILEQPELGEGFYRLFTRTQIHPTYAGEDRTLTVFWHKATDSFLINPASLINPYPRNSNWASIIFLALFITAFILLVLSEVVPLIRKLIFKKRYVVKYGEWFTKNKRRLLRESGTLDNMALANYSLTDPVSGAPFQVNDLIVAKCEHIISLRSWNRYGHCEAYPEECSEGVFHFGFRKFFTQQGFLRPFNWFWFGCVGGLIAWLIQAFSKMLSSYSMEASDIILQEGFLGLGLGLGLGLMLSWVEERGQTRKLSWLRILLRALLAGVAGMLIFSFGALVKVELIKNQFWGSLLSWLLFGPALGYILSLRSSISWIRGILGGVISSVFGFGLYYILFVLIGGEAENALMLSFIALGGLLGLIIVTVVKSLEDFELEYLSPISHRRVNPISKWLKAGIDVMIGTDPNTCEVYVKWGLKDQYVKEQHARLVYTDGNVFLQPLAETLINGEIATPKKSHMLKSGDIIQLGRDSITKMLFREKSKGQPKPPKGIGYK